MLLDGGAGHDRIRIQADSRTEGESSLDVHSVHVICTNFGAPEPSITLSRRPDSHRHGRAIADGGQTDCDQTERSNSKGLGTIFVDITGTEEVVDEQELDRPTRHLSSDDEDNAVSEYLSTVTRDDGLADSLPDGQPEE